MNITEQQAIEYLTGLAIAMRKKIEIFDSNNSDTTEVFVNPDDLFITQDERLMCGCLELVITKAKSNALFSPESSQEGV